MTESKVQPLKDATKCFVSFLVLTTLKYGRNRFSAFMVRLLLKRFFDMRLEVRKDGKEEEVAVCRYKNGAKGALCISIDFDLPTKTSKGIR